MNCSKNAVLSLQTVSLVVALEARRPLRLFAGCLRKKGRKIETRCSILSETLKRRMLHTLAYSEKCNSGGS
jgi:hypothetical protein